MWCHFEIFLEKSGPRYSARHKSENNHKPTKKNHFWYCTRMYLNWCKCYWQPTQTVWLRWIGRGEFLAWIVLKKIKVFFLGFDLERYLACGIPAIPGNLFTLTLKKCVNKQQIMDRRFIWVSFEAVFSKNIGYYPSCPCDSDRICFKFYSRHNGNTSFIK